MPPLSDDEIRQLTAKIQGELAGTDFACSSLTRIPGGSASFVFRGDLMSPLSLREGSTLRSVLRSVIVKKATDFATVNSDFALDSERSVSNGAGASPSCVLKLTSKRTTRT